MQEWEYATASWNEMQLAKLDDIQKFLNDYGKNGWELVSAAVFPKVTASSVYQGSGAIGTDFYTLMIFKRPKLSG